MDYFSTAFLEHQQEDASCFWCFSRISLERSPLHLKHFTMTSRSPDLIMVTVNEEKSTVTDNAGVFGRLIVLFHFVHPFSPARYRVFKGKFLFVQHV